MKTALLLNNTQLGPNHIAVTSPSGATSDGSSSSPSGERESDDITQEEKPRTRILAEYLAHGYVVGDAAIEHAIDLDTKHGVSTRFLSTIENLDKKYHATDRAKTADESYGISNRANHFFTGLNSYFEKATATNTGRKIVKFYTEGSRQVQDIHAEARRLADIKKEQHGGSAYKAAGFQRIFGEKPAKPEAAAAPAAAAPTTDAAAAPAAAAAAPSDEKKA